MEYIMTWTSTMDTMEGLVMELHKEWEQSKSSKENIIIEEGQIPYVILCLSENARMKQKSMEERLPFLKALRLTKESYVLLRLMTKVKQIKELSSSDDKCPEYTYTISLDREESRLYKMVIQSNGRSTVEA